MIPIEILIRQTVSHSSVNMEDLGLRMFSDHQGNNMTHSIHLQLLRCISMMAIAPGQLCDWWGFHEAIQDQKTCRGHFWSISGGMSSWHFPTQARTSIWGLGKYFSSTVTRITVLL